MPVYNQRFKSLYTSRNNLLERKCRLHTKQNQKYVTNTCQLKNASGGSGTDTKLMFYRLDCADTNNNKLLFCTFSFHWYRNIFPFVSIFLLFIQLTNSVNSKLEEAVRRQTIYCHGNICDVVLAWFILYPWSTWLVTILVFAGLAAEAVYSIS